MSLIINNQDVDKLLNDIVKLTGESRTEAVQKALEERRLRLTKHLNISSDEKRLLNFLEDEILPNIPADLLGTSLTKAEEKSILGYGKTKLGSLVRNMKVELNPSLLEPIEEFCKRWQFHEFAVFGSALLDNFRQGSDVGLLVTFSPDADWSLLDHVQMTSELESIFEREVYLITERALKGSKN